VQKRKKVFVIRNASLYQISAANLAAPTRNKTFETYFLEAFSFKNTNRQAKGDQSQKLWSKGKI
jgi:hypothetical protein